MEKRKAQQLTTLYLKASWHMTEMKNWFAILLKSVFCKQGLKITLNVSKRKCQEACCNPC